MRKKPLGETRAQQWAKLFTTKTGSLYGGIRVRMRKHLNDEAYQMPFTLLEFRALVSEARTAPNRVTCAYCAASVKLSEFGVDHATPLSRGGDSEITNLFIVCKSCNTAKGELSRVEFCRLLSFMGTLPEFVAKDVLRRLKAGSAINRLRFLKGK